MNKKNDFSQKMHSYLRHPASLIMMILVKLAAFITFTVLIFLIVYILVHGVPYLKPSLFSLHYNSENASLMPALINTVIMTLLSLLLAVPIGIFSAIFLAEYAGKGNKFVDIIRLTTETLSGIPSIVYGLFGMLFFVSTCHWGFSLLAGAFTLAIMILPLIMRTTEEALLSVPDSYREGSFGLGAGKLRTVFYIVLPSTGIRKDTGSAYVSACERRSLYGSGVCNSSHFAGAGSSDQYIIRYGGEEADKSIERKV